jgi:phosphoribosyl-AMP cyclohydrolase
MNILDAVKFDDKGLVTAVAQDATTNQVLMVAYMNRETLVETLETKRMVYFSRSRQKRWLKGETSGHFQIVREVRIDCDGDAIVFFIDQTGAACHTGFKTCFYRDVTVKGKSGEILDVDIGTLMDEMRKFQAPK